MIQFCEKCFIAVVGKEVETRREGIACTGHRVVVFVINSVECWCDHHQIMHASHFRLFSRTLNSSRSSGAGLSRPEWTSIISRVGCCGII